MVMVEEKQRWLSVGYEQWHLLLVYISTMSSFAPIIIKFLEGQSPLVARHVAIHIVLVLFGQVLSYSSISASSQYDGGEWNFTCGNCSIKKNYI